MPRSLDLERLRQFEPVTSQKEQLAAEVRGATDVELSRAAPSRLPERWLSREPVRDGQISIKAPLDVIERFRQLCRDDRRAYADMLTILMEAYERRS